MTPGARLPLRYRRKADSRLPEAGYSGKTPRPLQKPAHHSEASPQGSYAASTEADDDPAGAGGLGRPPRAANSWILVRREIVDMLAKRRAVAAADPPDP